ncbi:DUF4198 domain-containing protein [Variovorax sp. J22P271]|uniref:DUF4198 domain-containing protein n=1 Tax=Variovorax davisae TaxID=3053515 RepID=UPI0025753D1D|nr:DUF4198 domain-containing protein [Variovorax sp. J22P271]MDM0035045.1 DUF4198 domain-containing protein [Variovorax sp. J22P271]
MTLKKTLLALSLVLSGAAHAHFVWLEPAAAGGEAKAYFGEWADDLRETEAGHLKLVAAPRAVAADGKQAPATRHSDHFSVPAGASGDARLVGGYVSDKGVVSLYQARTGRTETTARHALELVPQAPGSNGFTLLLNGKPLAKTKVVVFGPPKWEKSFYSDDAGQLTLQTPWPGQYVAEVSHTDKDAAGSWDGKPYTQTRHVATLSFIAK